MKPLLKVIMLTLFIISLPVLAFPLWNKDQSKKITDYVTPGQQQLASDLLMASGGIGLLTSSVGLLFSLSLYASDLTTSRDRYVLEQIRSSALKISIPTMIASGILFKLGRKFDNRAYYWRNA